MSIDAPPVRYREQPPHRWKWSIDDLRRFDEIGMLPPEHRFELMDGEVVDLMGASPRHDGLISALAALISPCFGETPHVVREEKTLLLSEFFAPLPDIVVARGVFEDYLDRFPSPGDALLVVELPIQVWNMTGRLSWQPTPLPVFRTIGS